MGLFKRKSRAMRRAEAKALKTKAKLEAKLQAKTDLKRIAFEKRSHAKALRAQIKSQRNSDRAATKVAQAQLKTAREGKLLSPTRVRRLLAVGRILAPILVPLTYRASTTARGFLDERRADRLGVPLNQIGQFSGQAGELTARIAGAERSLHALADKNPRDSEAGQFVKAMTDRLKDLATAVTAAEHMPASRRRAAQSAIAEQLDGIDADVMARLGVH